MRIYAELLDLLRDLPFCEGLGVKGDVYKIEQFHSEVSGINLELAGFGDWSALALAASYQMNARGMITVSLIVGDPEKELEKEDPVEPEPVPDVGPEKEKTPVAPGSWCKRSKPQTQDLILEGLYRSDESEPGLTKDIIDLDLYPKS